MKQKCHPFCHSWERVRGSYPFADDYTCMACHAIGDRIEWRPRRYSPEDHRKPNTRVPRIIEVTMYNEADLILYDGEDEDILLSL